ncbi:TetR/AcrR family transcriptional regulator [Paenarthrobacter sp. NPDC089989]|uniref:TetR/AcrR family transcriptional regulator n=1 Tax=unclassified Paenarthrobacter TaxID=2634190 RepID=UPI0038228927
MDQETRGPGRTGKRAPYANGARKRAELVEAAFQVFAEKGYLGLSIRQIAEAVGTSHTALLHHFGSKEALLQAVLVLREEREGPWRDKLIQDRGLLETVPAVMRHNAGIRGVIHLDATLKAEAINADHPAHEFLVRRNEDFVQSVRSELERELAAGRLREGLSPDVLARQITALVDGVQLNWLYDSGVDMAQQLEVYMDLIKAP